MAKVVSEQRAKQGRDGTRVFIVLVVALALAAAAWVGVEIYGSMIESTAQKQGEQIPANP